MRPLFLTSLFLACMTAAACAQEFTARNGAKAEITNGEVIIHFADKKTEWPPAVAIAGKKADVAGKKIVLSFEAKSEEPALPVRVTISEYAPPYGYLSDSQKIKLTNDWKTYSLTYTVGPVNVDTVNLPLFVFESFPLNGEVRVRNIAVAPAN